MWKGRQLNGTPPTPQFSPGTSVIVTHTLSGFFPAASAYAEVTAAITARFCSGVRPGVWLI